MPIERLIDGSIMWPNALAQPAPEGVARREPKPLFGFGVGWSALLERILTAKCPNLDARLCFQPLLTAGFESWRHEEDISVQR